MQTTTTTRILTGTLLSRRRTTIHHRLIHLGALLPRSCYSTTAVTTNATQTSKLVKGWEVVIGIEVHAQILAVTKLFSSAPTSFAEIPNSKVALLDAAIPGTLPVLNRYCVDQALKTAIALNGRVSNTSTFERKHYFYCDLPAGYQITQQFAPIMTNGSLYLPKAQKTIGISSLKLEQDSGKSIHDYGEKTCIDLNRAGSALMEIVSEPDLRSSEEASEYVSQLQRLLKWIGTCDANMEEGSLRCDVNISIRKVGESFGTRCEIKNMNSIKFLAKAIDYETERHIKIREQNQTVPQETRGYDAAKNKTYRMRSKEDEVDYLYMPEPDLPPLYVSSDRLKDVAITMPELPDALMERFQKQYGLSAYDAGVIIGEPGAATFFDKLMHYSDFDSPNPKFSSKTATTWLTSVLFGVLAERGKTIENTTVTPSQLASLVFAFEQGKVNKRNGMLVVDRMVDGDARGADEIITENSWNVVQDDGLLLSVIQKVIDSNPEIIKKYLSSEKNEKGAVRQLMGMIMKESKGKILPEAASKVLNEKLSSLKQK